jgi:hypothetical protein
MAAPPIHSMLISLPFEKIFSVFFEYLNIINFAEFINIKSSSLPFL